MIFISISILYQQAYSMTVAVVAVTLGSTASAGSAGSAGSAACAGVVLQLDTTSGVVMQLNGIAASTCKYINANHTRYWPYVN